MQRSLAGLVRTEPGWLCLISVSFMWTLCPRQDRTIHIWAGVITWWERQHPWGHLMVLFEEEDIKLFILIALVVRCRSQRVSLGFCFVFVLHLDDISDVISSSFHLAGSLMNSVCFIWSFLYLFFSFFKKRSYWFAWIKQDRCDLCFGTHL